MQEKRGFFRPKFPVYAGLLAFFLLSAGAITGIFSYIPDEHRVPYAIVSFCLVVLFGAYLFACFLVRASDLLKMEKLEYGTVFNAFLKHKRYRKLVNTYIGSFISLVFGAVYLVLSLIQHSMFYALLSEFYLLILAARIYLSHLGMQDDLDERKAYLFSSIMTLFLGTAMFGIVFYQFWTGQGFHGKMFILMIANAAYAFYKLVFAIIGYFSAKGDSHAYLPFSYAMIGMASALFTMYALQVSMIATFGGASSGNFWFRYGGFFFAGLLLLIGLLGLIRAIKAIRKGSTFPVEN